MVASIGPTLPPGTAVEVLAVSNVQRVREPDGVMPPVLARVRVVGTRQEGFTFVGPGELAPHCPLLSGARAAEGPILSRLGHRWRENYARPSDERPTPARLLTGWATPFDATRGVVLERLDLDHNGAQETLFEHVEDSIHTIVLWRGTRGMPGLVLTQEWDHDHHSIDYEGSVHAGRAVYFAVSQWSIGTCAYTCARATCDAAWRALYRLHPDGYFVEVATVPTDADGEAIELRGATDEGVVAAGRTTGRTQRLRWDAARFALVPEGEQMPALEAPPEGFCWSIEE